MLDEPVHPVQVDIREDGRCDPALRTAAQRGVVAPVLQVTRPEQPFDEAQEPPVGDLLGQDPQKDRVVERPEAVGDVAFDEPGCPVPVVSDLQQGRVASAAGAEPVGAVGELRLVVGLQQQPEDLLNQLARPGRQSSPSAITNDLKHGCGVSRTSPWFLI